MVRFVGLDVQLDIEVISGKQNRVDERAQFRMLRRPMGVLELIENTARKPAHILET